MIAVAVSLAILTVNTVGSYGIFAVQLASSLFVIELSEEPYLIASTVRSSIGVPVTVTLTAAPPLI